MQNSGESAGFRDVKKLLQKAADVTIVLKTGKVPCTADACLYFCPVRPKIRTVANMIMNILCLLGALGMFLYGMNTMSSGLQKAAGGQLRKLLSSMTSNPFKRVLTGFGITAVIQSSSATTVMVVGFVSAGLLSLTQAIGVIMGANIGTTMTAWIISIFGFKADVSVLAVPLMAVGFLLSCSKKDKLRSLGDCVVGFSLLFLGLSLMKNSVPDLSSHPEALSFIQGWSGKGMLSVLLFLILGTVLTLVLQSSSATVAITLIMLDMGWIQFDMAAAMVLGENIGTTITANIAAIVGNVNSKRAALAHTFFNVFGVVWALVLFYPFVHLIEWIISSLGTSADSSSVYGLSLFHTCFNLINTCLLIWFTPLLEKLVCAIVREKKKDDDNASRLQYLNSGLISTPELALSEASKESAHFAKVMKNGLEYIRAAIINSDKADEFDSYRAKLVKYENISDNMEYEIVSFLNSLDKSNMSDKSLGVVRSLLRICSELESLGDSGEAISRSLSAMLSHKRNFNEEHKQKLLDMTALLSKAYDVMISNLENAGNLKDIDNAREAEHEIDECRLKCREEELQNLENKGDSYFESIFFIDVLESMEKMGDYLINISEAVAGV